MYHYGADAGLLEREELRRIRDHMTARGPDGKGEWFSPDGRVGLGHRRLSIIDLSDRGAQPMASPDAGLIVTFNGEIYNYQALRAELEDNGVRFRSDSDTEVLLHLYAERGEHMVEQLRGMFAFALWDARKRGLLLARDPYGIKPLYYVDDGRAVRAASQVQALAQSRSVSRHIDPAAAVGFLLWGSVPEPYTIYSGVRAVPAGSVIWVRPRGTEEPRRVFSLAALFRDAAATMDDPLPADVVELARGAFVDSVRNHLVADVPVGVFLSAGVDSGAVAGLAQQSAVEPLQTVTLGFEEFRGTGEDEVSLAAQTAAHYRTRHTTRTVSAAEFREDLPRLMTAMDQPSIDGVNTWFVSKAAAELGLKVALSGLGGDELLGGYPSFRDIPRWTRAIGPIRRFPLLGEGVIRLLASLRRAGIPLNPKLIGLLRYGGSYAGAYLVRRGLFMPWELNELVGEDLAVEGLRTLDPVRHIEQTIDPDPGYDYGRVAAMEGSLYLRNQLLRDADWAGMSHSIEIRTPLVDAVLTRRLAPVVARRVAGDSKRLLANAPHYPLPPAVVRRAKTGFGVPMARWLGNVAGLDMWKRVALLHRPECHWSRRWAYTVLSPSLAGPV